LKDFAYAAPRRLDEAVALLAERGRKAKVLAGGTDIIVQLREGLREADLVLDVKKIPELLELAFRPDGGLTLGAAVPCHRLYADSRIVEAYPSLTDAARIIGGWQIQSRASVGGNLCNSSPAADTIPALIVEDAICRIAGPSGTRTVRAADFCTAPGKNVLAEGELLAAIDLPRPQRRSGSRYLRFIPRNEMDIAVAGAGAWVRVDAAGEVIEAARLALAAVAPTPVAALEAAAWLAGKPPTRETLEQAGELARKVARPISDLRAPADYRLHLVGVLVRRALEGAVARARGGDRQPSAQ
jgi:CO/xanthine dehydrogenase FAD-binding subunit